MIGTAPEMAAATTSGGRSGGRKGVLEGVLEADGELEGDLEATMGGATQRRATRVDWRPRECWRGGRRPKPSAKPSRYLQKRRPVAFVEKAIMN